MQNYFILMLFSLFILSQINQLWFETSSAWYKMIKNLIVNDVKYYRFARNIRLFRVEMAVP